MITIIVIIYAVIKAVENECPEEYREFVEAVKSLKPKRRYVGKHISKTKKRPLAKIRQHNIRK